MWVIFLLSHVKMYIASLYLVSSKTVLSPPHNSLLTIFECRYVFAISQPLKQHQNVKSEIR